MIIQMVTAFIGILVGLAIIIVAILFVFSKVRENDMTTLRNANKDLRDTVDDNATKITNLQSQVDVLIGKVETLERRNKTLEDLVVTALKQYFFENPKVAGDLKEIIKPSTGS